MVDDGKMLVNNICGGGNGVALAYCCSLVKPCPMRDRMLQELGIPKEVYRMIKERHGIRADGVCFGNLAYCCSLEKECRKRDEVLEKFRMDKKGYIEYKRKIAEDFYIIAGEKLFSTKVLHTYIANVLDLDTKEEFRMVLLGDSKIFRTLSSEALGAMKIEEGGVICVYLGKKELERLIELSRENGQSLTKLAKEILVSHLSK